MSPTVKWSALAGLALVVGLSLFGQSTYIDLREERATSVQVQTQLRDLATALGLAASEADSLRGVVGGTTIVYRDRVRTLPPDTVLVGLPPECDACVARSRAQDAALVAADSVIAAQGAVVSVQEAALTTARLRLTTADSSLTALTAALADRLVSTSRKILGVPLPEVVAGYGLSFASGSVQHGPVLALGWKVSF